MPINVKRSNNYSNQKLKIKNPSGFGRFITKLPPGVTLPVVACLPSGGTLGNYNPTRLLAFSNTVLSSSTRADPFIYGGFITVPTGNPNPSAIENFGYMWNSGSKLWNFRMGADPNSGYTTLSGEMMSVGEGKVMLIGGLKFDISIPAITYNSCSIYNASGDCWTYVGSIPGFSKTRQVLALGGNAVASNYSTGEAFVFGGVDSGDFAGFGGTGTWVNQMLVWNGSQFTNVGSFPFLTQIGGGGGGPVYGSLAVRDTPGTFRNKVMFHSSIYGGYFGGAVYLWSQNQVSPVSGTWSFKGGSNVSPGPVNSDIPGPYSTIMYDQVYNRWIAVSRYLHLDPNIWESTDDGTTWTKGWFNSHNFRYSAGQEDVADAASSDPGRNRIYFHIYTQKDNAGVRNGGLWELNIPSDINAATLVQVSGSAVADQFNIEKIRRLTQFGVTNDSPPKIFVYGGVSGSYYSGYGDGDIKLAKGFLYNQGTSAWTEVVNDSKYPSSDLSKGRFFGDIATLTDGNLLMIGGRTGVFLGGSNFRPYVNHNNSRKYTVSTNTWSGATSLSGYGLQVSFKGSSAEGLPATTSLTATDFTNGNVFLYGGCDGLTGTSWTDKLSVYDGTSWTSLGYSYPPVTHLSNPPPTGGIPIGGDATPSQQYYSLGARNVSGNTRLLLYQGQRINISGVVTRSQDVYKWDQTSSSPIAGTWSVVSGSTGLSESNKMPVDSATLMWEDSQSRWVAISNNPRTSPNIWSSTDDGLTWTAATYTVSSLAWEATRVADQIKPSPASSQFYIQSTYGIGKWGIWSVNVAASIGSSTLNLIYTN